MDIMSTAMISAFYDYGDSIYKPRNNSTLANSRTMGSPVSLQQLRRTSSTTSSRTQTKLSTSPTREQHRKLDRSLSEPVERSPKQSTTTSNQANSSRYKTELCRPYEENGTCKYGEKCQFAHGVHELRTLIRHPKYKTELCRTFHSSGFCPYGPRCHFIHNSEETKKNLLTHLQAGLQSVRSKASETSVNLPQPVVQAQPARPKALSIGSFSLGSTGDLSPPSSLSGSPTSPNSSFFDEPFGVFSPSSTPTPTNVGFAPIQPDYNNIANGQYANYSAFANELVLDLYRDQFVGYAVEQSPPSPVESLGSDFDSLSIGGSPVPVTCSSPLDVSRNLPRLPIFSRLANPDSD